MDRIGEGTRFHVGEGSARRAAVNGRHLNGNAEIAGLVDRLHFIQAGETCFIDFIEFAEGPVPDTRLVEAHRGIPWPCDEHRKALDGAVFTQEARACETVMQREAAL